MADEASFPIARASLIAMLTESILFGSFTVLYAIAIWVLLYREGKRSRSGLSKRLFATSTIMWILSATHLAIDLQRADRAFVVEGGKPDGATNFFNTLSNPTLVVKDVIYVTLTLVGDAFVTYRLFMVWNNSWLMVALSSVLVLATAVSGYGACAETRLAGGAGVIFARDIASWGEAFFALSFTTNLLATILIAGRIIWMNRRAQSSRTTTGPCHWNIIEALFQSAAIYSAALASLLGTYLAGSNAQYVCLDLINPLIGVVFTLIIIRLGLGETTSEVSARHVSQLHGQTIGGASFNMRPVAINVSVTRANDRQSLEMDCKPNAGPRVADN